MHSNEPEIMRAMGHEPLPPSDEVVLKGIPPEKAQAIIEYGKKLRQKFPHMKKERLGRKIAEYFKVKLT